MRYDFSKMSADAFELMVRSLNEKIFGVRCEQYGLGPDGQREFVFEGSIKDIAGVVFEGRTVGQVKYKYVTTKEDDLHGWQGKLMQNCVISGSKKQNIFRTIIFFIRMLCLRRQKIQV